MLRVTLAASAFVAGVAAYEDDPLFRQTANCPKFTCPAGKKSVQRSAAKRDARVFAYIPEASAFNMFSAFDASDLEGLTNGGGLPKKKNNSDKVGKCAEARDICFQTCGMTKGDCESEYEKCTNKKCKGDKNCKMQANFALAMTDIGVTKKEDLDKKPHLKDVADGKCHEYVDMQHKTCECVDKADHPKAFAGTLWDFYKKYAPKKLEETDAKAGLPEDHEEWLKSTVYSKTFKKGDEPKIYNALLSKYKDKAVARKQRPKPKYDDDYLKDDFKVPEAEPLPTTTKKPTTTKPKADDSEFDNWSGGEEVVEEEL